MKLRVLLVTVTLLVEVTWGEDIIRTHLNEVADHLIADNYLHKSLGAENKPEAVKDALTEFERFYHIKDDNVALGEMRKKNCQNPDLDSGHRRNNNRRRKRYTYMAEGKYKWGDFKTKMPVTIGFKNYWQGYISPYEQEQVAMDCTSKWAAVSGLSFQFVRGDITPNIQIVFGYIDGEGYTVGQAESPAPYLDPPKSELLLDKDEKWAPRYSQGNSRMSLQEALCHEMGHTLSLDHSDDSDAIMFHEIGGRGHDTRLGWDDIRGIQSLYGPPKAEARSNTNIVIPQTRQSNSNIFSCPWCVRSTNTVEQQPRPRPAPRAQPAPTFFRFQPAATNTFAWPSWFK